MSYVVLARKWRPQTFEDLVGQGHVSKTLENAIARDRVAHAFLFTGVRGVGKTTTARILAKALNCEKGPTAQPCLECPACTEIGEGRDVDVQEIDGASYTGVDAVRSLQETMPYRPSRDRYKLYIVDEVHMLSTAAWNAFLKTLEEPPPHVKFIFATTEVNKVPVTILSRCQRYDFKLIRTQQIAERLRFVLDAEEVAADEEAIRIVAREAAGSMRDAMSLLDQVIAWTAGGREALSAEAVARVLGVASRSVLHDLAAAIVDGEAERCLEIMASLAQQGFPLGTVARDFLEHLRQLVVAKVSKEPAKLLELPDEEVADVVALAERTSADDLSRLYLGFSRAYDDIVRSAQVRGAFEMALVRLAHRPPIVPVDELLRRLAELESRLGGGGRKGGGGSAGASGGGRGRGSERGRGPSSAGHPSQAHSAASQSSGEAQPGGGSSAHPDDSSSQPSGSRAHPGDSARQIGGSAARAGGSQAQSGGAGAVHTGHSAPRAPAGGKPPRRPWMMDGPAFEPPPPPASLMTSAARRSAPPSDLPRPPVVVGASASPISGSAGRPLTPDELTHWEAILEGVRAKNAQYASLFEHGALLALGPELIALGYPPGSFLASQLEAPEARAVLAEEASVHYGSQTRVEIDFSGRHDEVQTLAAKNSAEAAARIEEAKKRVEEHPLVVAAREVLGAELREVRLPSELH